MVYYGLRLAAWLAARVSRRVRMAIAGAVTELIYLGWVSKRHATNANMAQILGTSPGDPRAKRLARVSWRNFGKYISDFVNIPNTTREAIVARIHDTNPPPGSFGLLDEALARGKGAIVVSAHFGPYDVAAIAVASHVQPVHVIVETIKDPKMDRMWQEQRRALGMELLRIEKGPRQMLRVLQENGVVAVALDRPLPPGQGVPITFFGRRCWVPAGMASIALKADAAVVPGYCIYDEQYSDTYYLGAGPVIVPEHTGDKRGDVARLTQRMFDALEAQIRARPDQWAMFRRFWPEHDVEAPAPASAALTEGAAVASESGT